MPKSKINFPHGWSTNLEIKGNSSKHKSLNLDFKGLWRIYQGNLEAYLLNGSYSLTSGEFKGSQSTPVIDTHGPYPGPGWTLLKTIPKNIKHNCVNMILSGSNVKNALVVNIGKNKINKAIKHKDKKA